MQQRMLIQSRQPTLMGRTPKQKRLRLRRIYALLAMCLAGLLMTRV